MIVSDLVHINFDLLMVAISITGTVLLGMLIYINNPQSATNKAFFAFAILTAIWGISNYLEYRFNTAQATLWALRTHLFISTLHAYAFFTLALIFPATQFTFPVWYKRFLAPITAVTAFLTLTPLVFSGIEYLAPAGQVTRGTPGPGILLFMLVAFGLLISALIILGVKTKHTEGETRQQHGLIFWGMLLTAILILVFNVIFPNVFRNLVFIPLAALFTFPFILLTSYSIYRHHLLNLKVATTAFLGFMVTVFTFVNILYAKDLSGVVINVTAFLIVLLGSLKIVSDTLNLIRQRELIEKQEKELEAANKQQETLLHFISHEVKGYLTKGEAGFASIVDGSFGAVSDEVKTISTTALAEMRKGVETVTYILKASDFKKGTVKYDKKPFDFKALVSATVESFKPRASEKNLDLSLEVGQGDFIMIGDREKIEQHLTRNLLENSLNYTPSGSIKVSLTREGNTIRFTVQDTGVGITPEDMQKLFTQGGHGKDSIKVNVHSTGYGLFIAKQVVEAHGGKIWAESEGAGKGTRMVVEIQ